HTFWLPRRESSGALIRWPVRDQPGAGAKVRGTTGPSSSRHRVVAPSGGSVGQATTAVLLGRRPWPPWPWAAPPNGGGANEPLLGAEGGGPGCGRSGCPALGRRRPAHRATTLPPPHLGSPPVRASHRERGPVGQAQDWPPAQGRRCVGPR